MAATTEAPPVEAPVRTPMEAPEPTDPWKELERLEQEALRRGMPLREMHDIRAFGECLEQIQERIAELNRWLTRHPA